MQLFTFEEALTLLKEGQKVSRKHWNGKDMYIEIYIPVIGSQLTNPFICMFTAQKKYIPWLASQEDLLANDWFMINA